MPAFRLNTIFSTGLALICLGLGSNGAEAQTLEEALISAYNNNPRLLAARASLRELDETYVQARAQGRLTSNLAGTTNLNMSRTPALNIPVPGFDSFIESGTTWSTPISAQVQIIQPVYQGGRVSALKSQARLNILAAREGLRAQESELFLQLGQAYIDVIRDEETARIRRNNVRVLGRQRDAAESRFEVGAGTRTDLAQADARLAGAQVALAQADAQLQISRSLYKQLAGHLPEELEPVPAFVIPESEDEAIRLARNNNPGLIASVYREQAGDEAIRAAKSANKPRVTLNGSMSAVRGQAGFPDRAESMAIGAQLTIPLSTGGVNRSRVRAANEARTRLKFETRDLERQLDASIMQSWAALDAAQTALIASQVQIEAAELAFEGVQLEQSLGTRTTLDVLNAEQEVLEARLGLLNSRSNLEKATYQLLFLTGGFDAESLNLDTELYDPETHFDTVTEDLFSDVVDEIIPEDWR